MIRVVVDDLAFVAADAVIRPATSLLDPTSAALKRLEQVGGPAFWEQLSPHQELAVGSAIVTDAGDLAADFVVHAVICSTDQPVSEHYVKQALTSALQRAGDWRLARVAVPPMGTGAGNLDIETAAEAMVSVLGRAMGTATYPKEVYLVVEHEDDREVFNNCLKRLPQ